MTSGLCFDGKDKDMPKETGFFEKHVIDPEDSPIIYHHWEENGLNKKGFRAHWHPNLELLYFVEGAADISVNMEKYRVEKGELFLINSNCIHMFTNAAERTIYHCIIIDSHFCSFYHLNYVNQRFHSKVTDAGTIGIYRLLVEEFLGPKDGWQEENLKSLSLILMRNLYRHNLISGNEEVIRKETQATAVVKRVLEYINEHYAEELSLEEIGRQVNVSKYYLCRLFKNVVNQTMNSYIMEYRCSQARLLLQKSDLPVKEVAYRCGFVDPSYFSKCYYRICGKLPSAER